MLIPTEFLFRLRHTGKQSSPTARAVIYSVSPATARLFRARNIRNNQNRNRTTGTCVQPFKARKTNMRKIYRSHQTQRQWTAVFLVWTVWMLLFSYGSVVLAQEEAVCDNDGTCDTTTTISLPEVIDDKMDIGYGEPQLTTGSDSKLTIQRLYETKEYMETVVRTNTTLRKLDCKNRHENCAFWAAIGECDANPAYMEIQCAPSCRSCHKLLFESRCPMPANASDMNIWKAGDLDRMFEAMERGFPHAQVIYKPGMKVNTTGKDAPWVIVIDDFLTSEECERLIELGAQRGYERSSDVGAKKFDGTYDSYQNNGRTSTNAWCLEECYDDALTKNVLTKIENLTGIPDANSEYLQLLKYEVGQFYNTHHDYINFHLERAQGVRILTVFLYLNDVEEGGGTNFPKLNVTVEPKRGRVLVWPSVKNESPDIKDFRTDHQALPVIQGVKYGANAWLHQRDFKTPFQVNCI